MLPWGPRLRQFSSSIWISHFDAGARLFRSFCLPQIAGNQTLCGRFGNNGGKEPTIVRECSCWGIRTAEQSSRNQRLETSVFPMRTGTALSSLELELIVVGVCSQFGHIRAFRVDPRGMSEEDVVVNKFKEIVANKNSSDNEKGDVAVEAMRAISQMTPYSIANIFNSCKKGNYIHKDLFELMVQWIKMYDDMIIKEFSTIELTMTIQSIGKLAHSERRLNRIKLERYPDAVEHPVDKSFFPGCKDLVTNLLREFVERDREGELECDARSIADIIHGVGMWYHRKEGRPIDKLAVSVVDIGLRILESERIFQQCTPADISNVCFGCGSLEYADEKSLRVTLDRLENEFDENIPSSVRSGTWRCGGVDSHSHSLDIISISNIIWGLGKVRCLHAPVLRGLLKEFLNVVKDADEQSMANIVFGLALVGYKGKDVIEALSREIGHKSHMMHYREMDLANIVYAFGLLEHLDKPAMQALAKEISKPLRLGRYKELEVSNILHGMALLKYYDQDCLDALGKAVVERNLEFPVHGLSTIINACGRLKYFNKAMMEKLCRAVIQRQNLARLKEGQVSGIVLAFSRLGYFDAQVMAMLSKVIHKKLGHGNFSPKDVSNLVYGLGRMSYTDDRITYWLTKILVKPPILKALTPQGFCGVLYGLRAMNCDEPHLVEALRKESVREERSQGLSKREKEFAFSTLQKMRLSH